MIPKPFRSALSAVLLAVAALNVAPARSVVLDDASLAANRNRLFADWAARNGQPDVCQVWQNLSCTAKGSFLTLTHRLAVSMLLWDSTIAAGPAWRSGQSRLQGSLGDLDSM